VLKTWFTTPLYRLKFCRIEEKGAKAQFLQSAYYLGEGQPALERVQAVVRSRPSFHLNGHTTRCLQDLISVGEVQQLEDAGARY